MSELPKIFWKYFDLYRRKIISIDEFSENSGIDKNELEMYLKSLK